jgi:BirA family transcriptional regulator, biotin operon repressor / biotin---[acetyl-CoA-carboxylase] ligase
LFAFENFDIKLDTEYIGRKFFYFDETESTNLSLSKNTKEFKDNGTVLFAENQTGGKGRKNRTWSSAKGFNLTFSILLSDPELVKIQPNIINLSSSLSIATSIQNIFQLNAALKWPNDVLINNKKVAGILLESSTKGKNINRIIIGMGINVNQVTFPLDYKIPATSIKNEFKSNVERELFLAEILNQFEYYIEKSLTDPKYILKEWRSQCKLIGDKITILEGEVMKTGIFDDIDDDGFLLLKTRNGLERIVSGDVSIV